MSLSSPVYVKAFCCSSAAAAVARLCWEAARIERFRLTRAMCASRRADSGYMGGYCCGMTPGGIRWFGGYIIGGPPGGGGGGPFGYICSIGGSPLPAQAGTSITGRAVPVPVPLLNVSDRCCCFSP
uniref:(northern house mosquito) hypothetical protein n=1 Tax=Culex pipiens TaxID=7175 RepID=A0A8D8C974_CULPI